MHSPSSLLPFSYRPFPIAITSKPLTIHFFSRQIDLIPIVALDSTLALGRQRALPLLDHHLSRQLLTRSRQAHGRVWNKDRTHCHEVRNRTLGLFGVESNQVYGHQTGILAKSMGMRVVAHTPRLHMMTHGRTTNVKGLTTISHQADFMVILDDRDLIENRASVQVRRSLEGQILIYTNVGDDNGQRTKNFLSWLESAVDPRDEKDLPIILGGVAIVVSTSDFDEEQTVLSYSGAGVTQEEALVEEMYDEGYSSENYAYFKTGRYGRASSAIQNRRPAWRDQLRRLGVENVVLVPQHSLETMESYLVNAQKFAHKISSLRKEVMQAQKITFVDSTVPHYHSQRQQHDVRFSGMAY